MNNIIFIPPAEEEMINSALYYEEQVKNLGHEFLFEVQESIEFISGFPLTWPIISDEIRRCLVNRFPYGIYYIIIDEKIVIISIANLHRKSNFLEK